MFTKGIKVILLIVLVFSFSMYNTETADAATKVMWGKTELKLGQVGKATILADTLLVKLESNGSLTNIRTVKKGEEYRVYSYKSNDGGLYGVGGGSFIQKSSKVKYETPSKSKLALLNDNSPVVTLPTPKPNPVTTNPVVAKNSVKDKLNTIKNTKYKDYKEYANAVYKLHSSVSKNDYNNYAALSEAYFNYGIEVDEVVIEFNDGTKLLAFRRSPEMYNHGTPTNRSATYYNNEYYLSVPILEYIVNAHMNTYSAQKNPDSYDGKFFISGSSAQTKTEFKDANNKQGGYYNIVSLTNFYDNKSLVITEKEYLFVTGGVGLSWSSIINPYSVDEVKSILDMKFDLTYDKASGKMTIYLDKPVKDNVFW